MQDIAWQNEFDKDNDDQVIGEVAAGSSQPSAVTQLLEKRREMYEVDDALEAQKSKYAAEEETFRNKEDQLRAKDLQLQHQLIKFNKFLQDNEGKRRRAEVRAGEESAQIREKENEIDEIERQLRESHRLHRELQLEVNKNGCYEAFLELVRDTSDEYNDIQDILTRYHSLEEANEDLREAQSVLDVQAEDVRGKLQSYNKQKAMEILGATNRAASLQSQLEDAEKLAVKLDEQVNEVSQQDAGLRLDFGQIVASVENLFNRCVSQRPQIQHGSSMLDDDDEDLDASTGGGGSPLKKGGRSSSQKERIEAEILGYRKKTDKALKQLSSKPVKSKKLSKFLNLVICAYISDLRDIADQVKKEKKAMKKQHRPATFDRTTPSVAEIINTFAPPEAFS
ncbi:Coiled-coil domain containing 42 [Perkinsus chesapeaki]|uniref:Coiled-coil domain containing 42 n=1 Tax=Perkinsus chesapeaki TaxID=330153 RepID=A0A7J6LH61_PERCH|nr:Coiled-coil domain containing 42 [Perkinsus chesapeaki]